MDFYFGTGSCVDVPLIVCRTAGSIQGDMHNMNYLRQYTLWFIVCFFVLCFSTHVYAERRDPIPDRQKISQKDTIPDYKTEYVADEVMVKFSPDCSRERINEICAKLGLTGIKREIRSRHIFLLGVPANKTVEEVIGEIIQYSEVLCAEPNYKAYARAVPNDTYYTRATMYGFGKISAPDAWDTITNASSVVVAVLDSGVDYLHPDLSGNIWSNTNEIPNNGIDDDSNGYIDDVRGWNVYSNNNDVMEANFSSFHGTFVSGIIGAVGNNGGGITGVCWSAKIMPVRISSSGGSTSNFIAIEAIDYAVENGAKVINYSYGDYTYDSLFREALVDANKAGVLFVAAVGNESINDDVTYDYPCGYAVDNVIAVGASDSNDNLASFSNYGVYTVDIVAPGDEVLSTIYAHSLTVLNDPFSYNTGSGCSYATPYVAGACALVWATDSSLTHLDVKKKILNGADSLSSLNGYIAGGRRLNIENALAYNPNPDPGPVTDPPDGTPHSTYLETTNDVGIIVERAMYWDSNGVPWVEGHCSPGMTSTSQWWFLAEGSTSGFDTYILVQNPNDTDAVVWFTYMDENGSTVTENETILANSRYTRKINDISEMNNKSGVSTYISSWYGVIAERAMYWDIGYLTWAGGHNSGGVPVTSATWYLAEGSTSGFDTFILIQNPFSNDANVTFTYMAEDGDIVQETAVVSANSRYTRKINDVTGMNNKTGVSTMIQSDIKVIAERAMYWDAGGVLWKGGHCTAGVTGTSTTWYLAEGSTNGFDTFVLVQNPTSSDANVTFTYMDDGGNTVQESATVSAYRRYTRKINDVSGMNNKGGVSTKIESTNSVGIIAERAMYWDYEGVHWIGGHCATGVTNTARTWYLAEGSTQGTFDEWILIQNPNSTSANVRIKYMREDGAIIIKNITVDPNSRYTINTNGITGL